MGAERAYPPEAYSDGTLWWHLSVRPGAKKAKFGDEPKIAAFLAFALGADSIFTLRELRAELGEGLVPNNAEHFNRRLRELRVRDGWVIPSARDDGTLRPDEYRIVTVGWHPGSGRKRPKSTRPSDATRRRVFERDLRTCQVCGIAAAEEYPDMPGRRAKMTLGHRIPGRRADRQVTVDELQAECAVCNETVRDELPDPPHLAEVLPRVRQLRKPDKAELIAWIFAGRRIRSRNEEIYSSIRQMTQADRDELMHYLQLMVADPFP